MYVTHDRVHCHWRWQCHIPLFASFRNWDGRLQWMTSLVIQMDECLVNKHHTLKLHLKVCVIIASYQDLFWVMIGWIIFCPRWSFYAPTSSTYPPLISTQKLTAMEHVLHVISHHSQIITQTSIKSCQMCANDLPDHKEKLQASRRSNFQKRNDQLAWDVTISAAIQLGNSMKLGQCPCSIVIFKKYISA